MTPVEEFLQEKVGGFGREIAHAAREHLPKHLANAAATGAVGVGLGAATVGASKLYDAVTKQRDFRQMLDSNPDLHEALHANPKQFNQMFTTLRTFNPAFSKDPLVAGTYMRRMSESPMLAGGLATEALGMRERSPNFVMDTAQKSMLKGFGGK